MNTSPIIRKFETDGCSGFMSFFWQLVFKHAPPWEGGCEAHDFAYYQGGPLLRRLVADWTLAKYVKQNGHPVWAVLMFIAVRLGGVWWIPFPAARRVDGRWRLSWNMVRWGYGRRFPFFDNDQTLLKLAVRVLAVWGVALLFLLVIGYATLLAVKIS